MDTKQTMRTVVFARFTGDFRTYKIAKALKKAGGYRTVFLRFQENDFIPLDAFDRVVDVRGNTILFNHSFLMRCVSSLVGIIKNMAKGTLDTLIRHAMFEPIKKMTVWKPFIDAMQSLKHDADVFHAVTEPNTVPEMVIRYANKPVVYDVYDFSGIRFGVEALTAAERERERYCLEHASGISMKFPPSILDYYKNLGYQITCPVLTLIDYCLPEFFAWKDTVLDPSDIHVVYAGIVNPSSDDPLIAGNNQYIDIIKSVIAQKIYFHLYVSPVVLRSSSLFADYHALAKETKYFVMHESKGQPELQRELSQYHFGVILNDFSKTKITKLFEETSFGNKFSTYLEAGLPIIVNENLKLNTEHVMNNKVGFKINPANLSDLSSMILSQDYKALKDNVRMAREHQLNIHKNIHLLTEFYEGMISR